MSVSNDGKTHKSAINVKYGDPFPKAKRSMELYNKDYGNVLVYIKELGTPYWTERMTVKVPFRYYITGIIQPNNKYLEKKKQGKSNLRVIQGG
ncbi:hypothetical protein [Virgibacillus siamensis]|uniref:hypothetical protein n=1 Tax=Virgibacillus siamensis TaxID=480071 RepID=UPI000984F790|nr:hypothetical protein [Virgibacillus siamensis]